MKYNIVYIENTVQYAQFDMLSTTCMVEFQNNIANSTVCMVVYVQLVQYCVCSTVRLVLYVKCSQVARSLLYSVEYCDYAQCV